MRRIAVVTTGTMMALLLGATGLAGPAGATTGSSGALSTGGLVVAKKAPPNVNIATPGPVYSPTSVTATKVSKKCTKKYSFTVSNTTKKTQQIVLTAAAGGGNFGPPIPTGDELGVCVSKKGKFGAVFTLASNAKASLSITIK
jgi:hypothetical protein